MRACNERVRRTLPLPLAPRRRAGRRRAAAVLRAGALGSLQRLLRDRVCPRSVGRDHDRLVDGIARVGTHNEETTLAARVDRDHGGLLIERCADALAAHPTQRRVAHRWTRPRRTLPLPLASRRRAGRRRAIERCAFAVAAHPNPRRVAHRWTHPRRTLAPAMALGVRVRGRASRQSGRAADKQLQLGR